MPLPLATAESFDDDDVTIGMRSSPQSGIRALCPTAYDHDDSEDEAEETLLYKTRVFLGPVVERPAERIPSLESLVAEEERAPAARPAGRADTLELSLDSLVAAYEERAHDRLKRQEHFDKIIAQAGADDVPARPTARRRSPLAARRRSTRELVRETVEHHGYKILFSAICVWGVLQLTLFP